MKGNLYDCWLLGLSWAEEDADFFSQIGCCFVVWIGVEEKYEGGVYIGDYELWKRWTY